MVPETEWDSIEGILSDAWRPSFFEAASRSGEIKVYEFRIDDWTGIKHQGLPPGLEANDE